jgi:hypothetical protein
MILNFSGNFLFGYFVLRTKSTKNLFAELKVKVIEVNTVGPTERNSDLLLNLM